MGAFVANSHTENLLYYVGGINTLDGHNRSSGIFAVAFPQGYLGRERPSQGVSRK